MKLHVVTWSNLNSLVDRNDEREQDDVFYEYL